MHLLVSYSVLCAKHYESLFAEDKHFLVHHVDMIINNRCRVHTADIFDVRDEKLFSAMCNCLHHLLPSERDTGHE